MVLPWWAYAVVFAATLLLAGLLTPLMLRFALRRGVFDLPGEAKSHSSPVPYLGGVGIVVAFTVAVLVAGLVVDPGAGRGALVTILACGAALSLVGLLDDLRGLGPAVRLAAEAAAGVAVWAAGAGVALSGRPVVDLIVTVVWIVAITNALNMLDNMDGLSAGVSVIAAGSFFAIALLFEQYLVAALAAALAGCALGFLRSNVHPARIYMGDAGSMFLGFLLAVLGTRLRLVDTPPLVAAFVPVLVLGIAVFDMVLVVVNRVRHGRNPMAGGRDHTSHRLVFIGLPVPIAVGLIWGGGIGMGWLAVLLSRLDAVSGLLLVAFVLVALVVLGCLLSAVPVYENSRRRATMLRLVSQHEDEPLGLAPVDLSQPVDRRRILEESG